MQRNSSASVIDEDSGFCLDECVEIEHVVVTHADATVAGWGADEFFLVGAMDVDVAIEGVGVVFLQAI